MRKSYFAVVGIAGLAFAGAMLGVSAADTTTTATDNATVCTAAQGAGNTLTPDQVTFAQNCVAVFNQGNALLHPTPTPSTSSATPTPSPSVSTPPLAGYPDATNTGPAGTLTAHTGDITITTAGSTLQGMNITGCVLVKATGVTIKNNRIDCNGGFVINSDGISTGAALTITNNELTCNNTAGQPGQGTAIIVDNFVASGNNIHGCENGFYIGPNSNIHDNYVHDLLSGASGAHTDGLQTDGAASNVSIVHNTFDSGPASLQATSAIIYDNQGSGDTNVNISDNLLAGGGYTLYCPRGADSAFTVQGNKFSTKYGAKVGIYGPTSDCATEGVGSTNVYYPAGTPLATPLG